MGHKENCNFFDGEACICRSSGEVGWEWYHNYLPPSDTLGPTIQPKPIEIPKPTDNAVRFHFGVFSRLGENYS